jgi:hypothetical protein
VRACTLYVGQQVYRVQSHTDAAYGPEYGGRRVFPHTANVSIGCNRPLLYCEDEYVRACTLYVGQQVCACLHPVRGIYREDEYVRACTLYAGQQVCACLHPVRGS